MNGRILQSSVPVCGAEYMSMRSLYAGHLKLTLLSIKIRMPGH